MPLYRRVRTFSCVAMVTGYIRPTLEVVRQIRRERDKMAVAECCVPGLSCLITATDRMQYHEL